MEKQEFLSDVCKRPARELANFYFASQECAAFDSAEHYRWFTRLVQQEVGGNPEVAVVGTGNWKYSLNPNKGFKTFDDKSDIDVAVVSPELFHVTWDELRQVHRKTWYAINKTAKESLLRNGENVYCGFVSPKWIPGPTNGFRYEHLSMLNRLSNQSPGKREVKMIFFKNSSEAIDYYRRGFQLAKWSIK